MDIVKALSLILSLILAFTAAVLTIGGGADGLWEHEGVMQVRAPRTRVFEWLTEPEKRKMWVEGLVESKTDPPGYLKEGSRLVEIIEVDGERRKRILEVTEIEDGAVFAYRTTEGGVEIEMRYRVSVFYTGGKSRLDYTCQAQYPDWWAKVIEPILGYQRLSRMEESFARLTSMIPDGD